MATNSYGSSPFYDALFGLVAVMTYYRTLLTRVKSPLIPYTQACIPGFKIFVNTNGTLLTCERVGNYMTIGSIRDGLDLKMISGHISEFQETILKRRCKYCPVAFSCLLCHEAFYNKRYELNKRRCNLVRQRLRETLAFTMSAYEKNPGYFTSFMEEANYEPYVSRFL